ncbi:hypothetical protein ABE236_26225 [Priestia endophytica]|uniref:hypothetical protein n=1 Tax=Priestia endophytica TaxID=135735 RepID=UPI003D2B810D
MFKRLFKRKFTEKEFWTWFEQNCEDYFQLDQDKHEILFNRLASKLSRYHPDLVFEFNVEMDKGRREFIISADGIISAFPAVTRLVEAAPPLVLKKFNVIAFRQRQIDEQEVHFEDISLNTKDVFFTYTEDTRMNRLDLVMHIRGYNQRNEHFIGAAFILLDSLIGEYDVGTKIGEITFEPYQEQEDIQLISSLASLVDKM